VRSLSILALLLAACSPSPPPQPQPQPKPDPTKEAWYGETVAQLTAMGRDAASSFQHGRAEEAAALVTRAQPLIRRLLSAPQPTLPAIEAISDLDQLYGQMLLRNGHYVWARDFFQKNVTRWTTWTPQTSDTLRRLAQARSALADCDRRMTQ
jgi:hypothetical protein